MPFSVREGINIFLAGFVPTENLRFRDEELNFKLATSTGSFSQIAGCILLFVNLVSTWLDLVLHLLSSFIAYCSACMRSAQPHRAV